MCVDNLGEPLRRYAPRVGLSAPSPAHRFAVVRVVPLLSLSQKQVVAYRVEQYGFIVR